MSFFGKIKKLGRAIDKKVTQPVIKNKVVRKITAPITLGVTAPLKVVSHLGAMTGNKSLKKFNTQVNKVYKTDVKNTKTHLKIGAAVGGGILAGKAAGLLKPESGLGKILGMTKPPVGASANDPNLASSQAKSTADVGNWFSNNWKIVAGVGAGLIAVIAIVFAAKD